MRRVDTSVRAEWRRCVGNPAVSSWMLALLGSVAACNSSLTSGVSTPPTPDGSTGAPIPGTGGRTGTIVVDGSVGTPVDGAGGAVDGSSTVTGRYVPLVVGARWTWNGFDTLSGLTGVVDSTVEARETLTGAKSGIVAFRVRNKTLGGATVNWQQDTGTAIVRHREQFLDSAGAVQSDHLYAPSKIRLDESAARTALNARWTETYSDTVTAPTTAAPLTVSASWVVEAVNETVTVPAGTFSCLRVHSVQTGGAAYDSTFWFARNVGKVKEEGTEVRQLTSYFIP